MQVNVINRSKHPLPQYETIASAGMDVRANIDEPFELAPLQRQLVLAILACKIYFLVYMEMILMIPLHH